jgi:hypothetical protein
VPRKHIAVTVFATKSLKSMASSGVVVYENKKSPSLKSLQDIHYWNRAIASGRGTKQILNQSDLAAYTQLQNAAERGETVPKLRAGVKKGLEQKVVGVILSITIAYSKVRKHLSPYNKR